MEQRTPFGPKVTPTPMLLPSPCEARKTGGTSTVCDGRGGGGGGGGWERLTLQGVEGHAQKLEPL